MGMSAGPFAHVGFWRCEMVGTIGILCDFCYLLMFYSGFVFGCGVWCGVRCGGSEFATLKPCLKVM